MLNRKRKTILDNIPLRIPTTATILRNFQWIWSICYAYICTHVLVLTNSVKFSLLVEIHGNLYMYSTSFNYKWNLLQSLKVVFPYLNDLRRTPKLSYYNCNIKFWIFPNTAFWKLVAKYNIEKIVWRDAEVFHTRSTGMLLYMLWIHSMYRASHLKLN